MKLDDSNIFSKMKPWYGSMLLLPIAIYLAFNRGEFLFFDYINLLIHEGGHGIFRIFGDFIYTFGGTLMQLLIPGLFIFYFYTNEKKAGIQISMIWLGESLMNVAVYAADARARRLPLLGGNKVYHDWTYLLSRTNLLEYDVLIGEIFYFTALLIFIAALLLPLKMKDYEKVELDLNL